MDNKRTIGLLGAISIGVGGMVGGGIFAVLGEAVSLAHGATALAFLFAGVVAFLTSYSYSKLSVRYQSRGGTVIFIDNAFNHNLLSSSINLMLWLSYLVTISLYAVAFASYAQTFFPDNKSEILKHILISTAIILPAIINLVSASFVSKSETYIVSIKIILLIVIIVFSTSFVDIHRLSPVQWGSNLSIFTAGMIIFVAYEGFELIANAAADIKNPVKNLPRAFYLSVFLVVVLYILIAMVTVGVVSEDKLMAAKDYALAIAAEPALGHIGFVIVTVAALLATFSAISATFYGNARLGFILAKEGELPEKLDKEMRDIPMYGIFIILLLSLIIANLINLTQIAIIASASFLLIFFIINISAYKLYKELKANRTILLLSIVSSFLALVTLLVHTYENNYKAIVVFISFIVVSILFELSYGVFIRGHFFKREY